MRSNCRMDLRCRQSPDIVIPTDEGRTAEPDPLTPQPPDGVPAPPAETDQQTLPQVAPTPPRQPAPAQDSRRWLGFRSRRRRLARAPDMLGDSLQPPIHLLLNPVDLFQGIAVESVLPVAGGSWRSKISEHNKALPVDRIFAGYNYFHNAVSRGANSPGFGDSVGQEASASRFTLGTERTIRGGDASVEIRFPLNVYPDLAEVVPIPIPGPNGNFVSDTGSFGNLSVVGKHVIIDADDLVVSGGVGLEFPTGSDASVISGTTLFELDNQSVFLQPFLAAMLDNGDFFAHSFLQLDFDLTGSTLEISDITVANPPIVAGRMQPPTLIHWDAAAGVWLMKSDANTGLTGLAALVEFHMSSGVGSADEFGGQVLTVGGPVNFATGTNADQYPATYLTTGLHAELAQNCTVRVAGVVPLRSAERLFDGELVVQVARRY